MLFFFYLITACVAVPKNLVPQATSRVNVISQAEGLLSSVKRSGNGDLAKILMSTLTDADPDAVNHVKDLVQALIDAGEAERNVATQDRDDAQDAFDVASGNLDTATDEHTTVAGELSNARDEVARLTNLKADHLEAQENAQDAFNNAEAALADAESWLSDETVRIDGERATLLEIRDLLDTLLPGSSNACTDAGDFAVGDGSGGTEQFLGWVSSIQECLDMIADANVPNGNGITVHPGVLNGENGRCYVEIGVTGHNGNGGWRTCAFDFDINA